MLVILEMIPVGSLQANSYIIGDEETGQAVVVDPGDEGDRILEVVKANNLKVNEIICTHAHFDHVGAVGDLKKKTGAKIIMHKEDLETYSLAKDQGAFWGFQVEDLPQPDGFVEEGDDIKVGSLSFKVIHTPGHSRGGICLYGEGIVFTGDTIFKGSIGRTDFPGGSIEELKSSFRRIIALPDDTRVLSGHGPETTIGFEKKTNFFMSEI